MPPGGNKDNPQDARQDRAASAYGVQEPGRCCSSGMPEANPVPEVTASGSFQVSATATGRVQIRPLR